MARAFYSGITCLVMLLHAQAEAGFITTTIEGTVANDTEWGIIQFHHVGGGLTIDMLASGWTGGIKGHGIDDGYLSLFTDDSSPLTNFTGSFIAANDDDGVTLDSFIDLSGGLVAGNYLLAISHGSPMAQYDFDALRDIRLDSGIHTESGNPYHDYQITFTTIDPPVSPVPEPSTLAMFGIGACLTAIRSARRRRKDRKVSF